MKPKAQISCAVTAQLISAFVFTTWIVLSLFFLNPKFQFSSLILCLYSSFCVGLGQKPKAHSSFYKFLMNMSFIVCMRVCLCLNMYTCMHLCLIACVCVHYFYMCCIMKKKRNFDNAKTKGQSSFAVHDIDGKISVIRESEIKLLAFF